MGLEQKKQAQTFVMPNKFLDDDIPLQKQPSSTEKKFKEEGDFLYGHLSGNALQEFRVTKFNRKGKP
jgi:hypothetical protein